MQVTVDLSERETLVLLNLAARKELSPDRILIQALRCYQLVEEQNLWDKIIPNDSPGCGLVE